MTSTIDPSSELLGKHLFPAAISQDVFIMSWMLVQKLLCFWNVGALWGSAAVIVNQLLKAVSWGRLRVNGLTSSCGVSAREVSSLNSISVRENKDKSPRGTCPLWSLIPSSRSITDIHLPPSNFVSCSEAPHRIVKRKFVKLLVYLIYPQSPQNQRNVAPGWNELFRGISYSDYNHIFLSFIQNFPLFSLTASARYILFRPTWRWFPWKIVQWPKSMNSIFQGPRWQKKVLVRGNSAWALSFSFLGLYSIFILLSFLLCPVWLYFQNTNEVNLNENCSRSPDSWSQFIRCIKWKVPNSIPI